MSVKQFIKLTDYIVGWKEAVQGRYCFGLHLLPW